MIYDIIFMPANNDVILRLCVNQSSEVAKIAELLQAENSNFNFLIGLFTVQVNVPSAQVIPFLHYLSDNNYFNDIALKHFITRFKQCLCSPFTSLFFSPIYKPLPQQKITLPPRLEREQREKIQREILYIHHSILFLQSGQAWINYAGRLLYGFEYAIALQQLIVLRVDQIRMRQTILAWNTIPREPHFPTTEEPSTAPLPSNFFLCVKESRKVTGAFNSFFTLYRNDDPIKINFRVEHHPMKTYPHGGYAKSVKQGFVGHERTFAIKIFKATNPALELSMALRASFCSLLLGRKTGAVFCNNNKRYLLTDWEPGQILSQTPPEKYGRITERILLAIKLTKQIETLHASGIIHCDIKPSNVILSKTKTSLALIDFDSVRYKGEANPKQIFTQQYLHPTLYWQLATKKCIHMNEKSDMYALGLTFGFLFPELFTPEQIIDRFNAPGSSRFFTQETIRLNHGPQRADHKELWDLIFTLVTKDCPESIKLFLQYLCQLYTDHYKQVLPEDFSLIDTTPATCGKNAFEKIDNELKDYLEQSEIEESPAFKL
jgi:hypothetical protein